jgi:phosphatidylinositol alpha-1,6-mannosyltransferase
VETAIAMKMLALVSDAFGGSGGIARYNRDLFSALVSGDEASEIIVIPRGGNAPPPSPHIDQRTPRGRVGFVLAALWAAWRDGPFDAIFCGHLNFAPVAAIVAAMSRTPLWLQLHGIEAWHRLPRTRRWAVERASLVTAVSRYTRHRFLGLARIHPERLRVLPNTVDACFAPGPKPDYLLHRHNLHGHTVLLTVGRLASSERGKGHDRVIAALPALATVLADIAYLIVGDGDDRQQLEAQAQAAGVADRVIFTGAVSDAELPDYYRVADLFMMPSAQEGFGIVLLEAAASGLPIVAGNADGSADALADGALGRLIDPNDADALRRAVLEMAGSTQPPHAIIERFAFHNFADRARLLLEELVASNGQSRAKIASVGAD